MRSRSRGQHRGWSPSNLWLWKGVTMGFSRRIQVDMVKKQTKTSGGCLEFRRLLGGHYSRVKPVSRCDAKDSLLRRAGKVLIVFALVMLVRSGPDQAFAMNQVPASPPKQASDENPQLLFRQGEAALHTGDLTEAEQKFRRVLELNPKVAGAYANLGVIEMRRK